MGTATLCAKRQQTVGHVPLYNVDSSGGDMYQSAIVLSTGGVEPITIELPTKQQRTTEYDYCDKSSDKINNKGKEKATDETNNTNAGRRCNSFDIPKFDLGISPDKEKKTEEDATGKPKRIRKVGKNLKSPYLQRAVTFEIVADEKRIQEMVLHGVGGKR